MSQADTLQKRIRDLLSNGLGALPFRPGHVSSFGVVKPALLGLGVGLIYGGIFAGAPFLLVAQPAMPLIWLSVWGACYFAFATITAQMASTSIIAAVESRVLPLLSDEAIEKIETDIKRRFRPARLDYMCLAVASAAVVVSVIAIHADLTHLTGRNRVEAGTLAFEIGWWAAGFFILCMTGARATDAARFYGSFAAHLDIDRGRIYSLDPAHSLNVMNIISVGQRVLLFWLGILCSILTIVLFFSYLRWFVLFVVPTASFFSLGFGTLVFLTSERNISASVRHVLNATLHSTELEISNLSQRRANLTEGENARQKELIDLHKQLSTGGSYRSFVWAALSVIAPLAGPVVSYFVGNWKYFLN